MVKTVNDNSIMSVRRKNEGRIPGAFILKKSHQGKSLLKYRKETNMHLTILKSKDVTAGLRRFIL